MKNVLEPLNVIVAERFERVQRDRDTGLVGDECFELFYPDPIEPNYSALAMEDLSGVFAFLVVRIIVSCIRFALEIVFWKKFGHEIERPAKENMQTVQLTLNFSTSTTIENATLIKGKYCELIDLLAEHADLCEI